MSLIKWFDIVEPNIIYKLITDICGQTDTIDDCLEKTTGDALNEAFKLPEMECINLCKKIFHFADHKQHLGTAHDRRELPSRPWQQCVAPNATDQPTVHLGISTVNLIIHVMPGLHVRL